MIHRRHHATLLVALGLLLGLCGGALAQSTTPAGLISSFRLQHGEGKVRIDPTLNRIAREQAAAMAAKDVLDHDVLEPFNSRLASSGLKRAAENIAFGYDSFPKTLDQWIASSGHRSNLLMHGATRVGVASAKSTKTGRTYWAMVIAEERQKQAGRNSAKLTNAVDETCQIKLVSLCLY
jgi:Cysteine-rich secretory protein family